MRSLLAVSSFAAALVIAAPAHAERAQITATAEGRELHVSVHGITDYCAANAATTILRAGDTIRIIRERPTHTSRCFTTRDMTFVIPDVAAGTYVITYEQMPLVAPARPLRLASATAFVE